ncbi:hypothetical protein [Microbacterium hominis]|uniref:Uncharacterized protein n=1 Tax=Microbacterium hominis TaxID=162426 RepID=A0A7D4PKX7_9MICO|nr:hypothetical protein [Microbacterium hominis]QKJ18495.1 hypothetical protein HQM25_03225 [Microbacterium hominis]
MSAQTVMVITPAVHVAAPAPRTRGLLFWIRRYLPAEIVCTIAMLAATALVALWTDNVALLAAAAYIGETIGFYGVLAVTVYVEQRREFGGGPRTLGRTGVLLVAEFGPAEIVDSVLVRPAALIAGVWLLPDPLLGVLAGKFAADLVFYLVAAGSFSLTDRVGLRRRRETGAAA